LQLLHGCGAEGCRQRQAGLSSPAAVALASLAMSWSCPPIDPHHQHDKGDTFLQDWNGGAGVSRMVPFLCQRPVQRLRLADAFLLDALAQPLHQRVVVSTPHRWMSSAPVPPISSPSPPRDEELPMRAKSPAGSGPRLLQAGRLRGLLWRRSSSTCARPKRHDFSCSQPRLPSAQPGPRRRRRQRHHPTGPPPSARSSRRTRPQASPMAAGIWRAQRAMLRWIVLVHRTSAPVRRDSKCPSSGAVRRRETRLGLRVLAAGAAGSNTRPGPPNQHAEPAPTTGAAILIDVHAGTLCTCSTYACIIPPAGRASSAGAPYVFLAP